MMRRQNILALVMAGGEGGRMELLTEQRAKPVLPYAGVYRLIDFPLSHCVHSQIENVWVIEQFQPHSLNDHLANGRPWDLDRTYGGLQIIPPYTGTSEGGFTQGNADAIYCNRRFIREFAPDVLLVLSADHIYKLDYRDVIAAHQERQADVTMVTTRRPIEQASRHGVLKVSDGGKVTEFAYKPEQPASDIVTTEIFVYSAERLLTVLDELAQAQGSDEEEGLKDFGHKLIPQLVEAGSAYAYPLEGYWRDVGTIDAYWEAHMDLLAEAPPLDLDTPDWPLRTYSIQRVPARVFGTAQIDNSLLSPGCRIHGRVEHSVLGPGVVVEAGAMVRNAILFENTVVGAGATIDHAIVDSEARIEAKVRVGGGQDGGGRQLTLVGHGVRVGVGRVIVPGERVSE